MIEVRSDDLTLADVVRVAREREPFRISDEAWERVRAARSFLESRVAAGDVIYGVNTGVGHLAHVRVPDEDLVELQRNIIRSHAAGIGPALDDDVVRAILFLKIHCFAKGHSGVRAELVELLTGMLSKGVLPVIPAKGSLGASGDLAPLAHVGLAVLGEGEVRTRDGTVPARQGLAGAGLEPLELSFKEGLGIINGCQLMAGRGVLQLHDARMLLRTAQIVTAVILDVFEASARPFDAKIHEVRPHRGQGVVAENLRRLLDGERRVNSKVQDAYSLRCVPQILGGVVDAFDDLERRLVVEINAASDNPLVFPDEGEIIAAGNFHGESLGLALDHFGTALGEIASLAERQVNRLLNPALSGLPAFLAPATGKNSGLMILQYVAASLVTENKILSHPASADSIPVSADQEDHVSMGATAAHKSREILRNVRDVLGIAVIAAGQAVGVVGDRPFAPATRAFHSALRRVIPFWDEDRYAAGDMAEASRLVESGDLVRAVEAVTGELSE